MAERFPNGSELEGTVSATSRRRTSRGREEGSMLIVALAVLALLALIAVTFAALMRLERKATENYSNFRQTEMLAASAESSVIAMLRGGLYWNGYVQWNPGTTPWIYGVRSGKSLLGGRRPLDGDSVIRGSREALPSETSYSWHLGASYDNGLDYFKTKVVDTNSQININSPQDTLATMLDNLGEAIQRDPDWNINPMFERYPMRGRRIFGRDIMRDRATLEGGRFASKSQLRRILGPQNYEIVADFLTTQSWVDPNTFRGSDGQEQNRNFGQANANTPRPNAVNLNAPNGTDITGSARLTAEARAPININTAPIPVLVAAIQGLSCRRPFPFATIETQSTENQNVGQIDIDGSLVPSQEELSWVSEPVWVYSEPLTYDQAVAIAQAIVSQRKTQPFSVWQSGQGSGRLGFEEFVNTRLNDNGNFFPPPTSVRVVNPRLTARTAQYRNQIVGGQSRAGRMYILGHPANEASWRRSRGVAFSQRNAWYFDMMRGMLMANFNPNTRINKYNPNHTVYRAVDKSNLIRLDVDAQQTPRPGHTTEFCFDSGGTFEITTVSEMTGAGAEGDTIGERAKTDFEGAERFSKAKRRTIVKIFDTLRHTTQFDFEAPFESGQFNSVSDRENVSTYPDPIDALHPELFFGSVQDGRVELTGNIDARRAGLSSVEQRRLPYANFGNFVLHYGARYREIGSLNRLFREARSGRNSQAYNQELRRVLDPGYSRSGRNFERRYSQDYWNAGDVDGPQIREFEVGTTALGTDLYPDGFNSSIFRTTGLGTRFLRFPASAYRTGPADQGAVRARTNDSGNVPYYHGGVAFWIKPEFNGTDPVMMGLVGCTQVQTPVGPGPADSEGTQFYIWRNTSGELRVSRVYYHQAFIEGQNQAIPLVTEGGDEDGGEEVDYDPRKLWARTDVNIDITDWRAHEWHHVAVEFNDNAQNERIRVWIDFAQPPGVISHNLGEERFCALNVVEPKDGLYVGGFFRRQAVSREGLFKFETNVAQEGGVSDPRSKRVAANATLDEFVTFSGTYNPPFGPIGYFTDEEGRYTNRFRIPMPEGIRRVRLRSFTWTHYSPVSYNGVPVRFNPQTDFSMRLAGVGQQGGQLLPVADAGGNATQNASIAGRWIFARGTLEDRAGEVVYQATLRPAVGGVLGARSIASPALDDVTLTYFLPSAQVLLSEEE